MFQDDPPNIDVDKVVLVGLTTYLLLSAFIIGIYVHNYNAEKPLRDECRSNPSLLYKNQCTDVTDCLTKCVSYLKKNPQGTK